MFLGMFKEKLPRREVTVQVALGILLDMERRIAAWALVKDIWY